MASSAQTKTGIALTILLLTAAIAFVLCGRPFGGFGFSFSPQRTPFLRLPPVQPLAQERWQRASPTGSHLSSHSSLRQPQASLRE